MINPNETHEIMAEVIKVDRRKDGSLRDLVVQLDDSQYESALGLEHDTVSVQDIVRCELSYRITSERYVIDTIKVVARFKGVSQ